MIIRQQLAGSTLSAACSKAVVTKNVVAANGWKALCTVLLAMA